MNLDQARAISDALLHRDAILGLEVSERPMMPMEQPMFRPTAEQIAAMDEMMHYCEKQGRSDVA